MFNFFKRDRVSIDPAKELEGLLKAKELLDTRFKNQQISNENYLKKAEEFNKNIEKCRNKIDL